MSTLFDKIESARHNLTHAVFVAPSEIEQLQGLSGGEFPGAQVPVSATYTGDVCVAPTGTQYVRDAKTYGLFGGVHLVDEEPLVNARRQLEQLKQFCLNSLVRSQSPCCYIQVSEEPPVHLVIGRDLDYMAAQIVRLSKAESD